MDLKSGYPFWPIADGLIRAYPQLDRDVQCDVAILGGGITGALMAYHLVRAGFEVAVIDKRDIGWGSTAASTALLQYEIDVPLSELARMRGLDVAQRAYLASLGAVHRLGDIARDLDTNVGFASKRSLYLASSPDDIDTLRNELEMRRAIGINVDWLDERAIEDTVGFARPAALLSHDAAQVDPFAFAHALLADAAQRGARVFDRTDVVRVDATRDGVTLRTASPSIKARWLVFASGYETQQYLEQPVARLASTFAIATEPIDNLSAWGDDQCMIWEHAHPYLYLRTTPDHRVIVGGEDEPFNSAAVRDALLDAKASTLLGRLREMFPSFKAQVAYAWAGTFGETRDGLAYVGEHPDWPSCQFALGYGGNGITFSLLAAEIIRDSLCGRVNPDADIFAFSDARL